MILGGKCFSGVICPSHSLKAFSVSLICLDDHSVRYHLRRGHPWNPIPRGTRPIQRYAPHSNPFSTESHTERFRTPQPARLLVPNVPRQFPANRLRICKRRTERDEGLGPRRESNQSYSHAWQLYHTGKGGRIQGGQVGVRLVVPPREKGLALALSRRYSSSREIRSRGGRRSFKFGSMLVMGFERDV